MSVGNFRTYMKNGFGFTKSFRFAFGVTFRNFVLDVLFWSLLFGSVFYSGWQFYSVYQALQVPTQVAYIKELEKVVDKCTSRGDNPINIDGELWMCGASRTGIKF